MLSLVRAKKMRCLVVNMERRSKQHKVGHHVQVNDDGMVLYGPVSGFRFYLGQCMSTAAVCALHSRYP